MIKMAAKWLKLIPYLWPKRLKNHTLWGRTYLYRPYKGVLRSMHVRCWWLENVFGSYNGVVYCCWLNLNHPWLNPWIHYTPPPPPPPHQKKNKACHLGSAMFIWRRFTLTAVLVAKEEGRVMPIGWGTIFCSKLLSLCAVSQPLLKIMFFTRITQPIKQPNSIKINLEICMVDCNKNKEW